MMSLCELLTAVLKTRSTVSDTERDTGATRSIASREIFVYCQKNCRTLPKTFTHSLGKLVAQRLRSSSFLAAVLFIDTIEKFAPSDLRPP